jgi:uncharacterized spore protein YtfJ
MSAVTGERAINGYSGQTAQGTIESVARAARPDTVFGQPIEREGITIIPCAEIVMGMGMGGGAGSGPTTEQAEKAGGEGIGAGGGAQARPVAAIVIAQGNVRVEPIVDATKVALAALTTVGFMTFWIARLVGTAAVRNTRPASTPTMRSLAKALRRS